MPIDQLTAFLLVVMLIEFTPGPNMGYLAIVASRSGRATGMATVAGVTLGLAIYLGAAVLGLAKAAARWPLIYDGLRWAGVAYLVWLALDTWRGSAPGMGTIQTQPGRLFVRGLLANLLNPKVAVFYVTLLPSFVRPEAGNVTGQTLALGAVHLLVSVLVHSGIVLAAGGAKPALDAWEGGRVIVQRSFAVGLLGIAVWLAIATRT